LKYDLIRPFAFGILGEDDYIKLNVVHETEPKALKSAAKKSVAEQNV
jgi:hypothetical protein